MWGMSYVNFMMDLASIQTSDTEKEKEYDVVVDPDDEEEELRKMGF